MRVTFRCIKAQCSLTVRCRDTVGIVATDPGYDRDGRRPQLWRDELETLIEGDWDWEEGQVADVERGQLGLSSSHGSFPQPIYNVGKAKAASRSATREDPGIGVSEGVTVNEQIVRWESTIPETKIIAHVPGEYAGSARYMFTKAFPSYRLHDSKQRFHVKWNMLPCYRYPIFNTSSKLYSVIFQ